MLPQVGGARPLFIEGAGGLMVPLNRRFLQIDLFARWGMPVILCASTRLGTINHSLLSIEVLKRRGVPLLGIAFVGDEQADSERAIVAMGGVRRLGRLPHLDPVDAASLHEAFEQNFQRSDFVAGVTT
jgi:dethiobiotin synthetase